MPSHAELKAKFPKGGRPPRRVVYQSDPTKASRTFCARTHGVTYALQENAAPKVFDEVPVEPNDEGRVFRLVLPQDAARDSPEP